MVTGIGTGPQPSAGTTNNNNSGLPAEPVKRASDNRRVSICFYFCIAIYFSQK